MSKLASNHLKIMIVIVIATILIVSVFWYLFVMQDEIEEDKKDEVSPEEEDELFSISIDKHVFSEDEPINVTFRVYNNQNETIEVSEYWIFGTLFFHLWNSSGEEIMMHPRSVPMNAIESVFLNPDEVYEETIEIKEHFGFYTNGSDFYFVPDVYLFNATYINFHPYENGFISSNGTEYHSNTIEIQVE